MNKLRSDSAFCQLTPEQTEILESWLFEERLGYPKIVEKLKSEFGLETSLTGVRRFYKRLEMERSRASLMDAVEMSGVVREALKTAPLKPGVLLLANKCAFELMMQPREDWRVRELTALMRAITSAEANARKQTEFEREEERIRVIKAQESWRMTPRDLEEEKEELRQERAAKKKAKQEAAAQAMEASNKVNDAGTTSPPEAEREKNPGASNAPMVSARPQRSDSLTPRGTSGERAGERGSCIGTNGSAPKVVDGVWQPSVLEQQEYAESCPTEEAENRLTPLNAA